MNAFIFPGQGSQHVGMGRDFLKAYPDVFEELFAEANEALGFDLKEICLYGPTETLTSTEIAQPAIVTLNVGIYRLLQHENITPTYVAGHSVGQFAALVAAGVFTFSDTIKIVHQRGKRMMAVTKKGTMLAVVCSRQEQLQEVIAEAMNHRIDVAGYNSPQQVVFSGEMTEIDALQAQLAVMTGVRAKRINVSQGFHSRLMEEMELDFMRDVQQFPMQDASIPVVLNCSALETKNKTAILEDIRLQCTYPVLWEQTISHLCERGVYHFIEVGTSRTLTGFMRAFERPQIKTYAMESAMKVKKYIRTYQKSYQR
ncbi:ACP S-malonyltransferase [Virgibacillus soli]|uniref:Malonyl CoA-acyl carrier protein transacylase n=1 Tax=Paracerasibacillus soli TaxID=480284 RepID=A0ABU5CS36_9BACI|nr:ACP S-malonyltransferase [Virgibacillus soli]MDY0409189.1 ACP S-malonyltransferase [Virgibacillus soli]